MTRETTTVLRVNADDVAELLAALQERLDGLGPSADAGARGHIVDLLVRVRRADGRLRAQRSDVDREAERDNQQAIVDAINARTRGGT